MKFLNLAIFFVLVAIHLNAQIPFSKNIDIAGYSDGGNSIHLVDSGYILTATSLCNNNISECFSILHTDAEGDVTNLVQYHNYPAWIFAGTANGNNGVAMNDEVGMYFSGTIQLGNPQYAAFLMRTNELGDSLWMKTYRDESHLNDYNVTTLFNSDTTLLILNGSSLNAVKGIVWLIQVDLDGNPMWEVVLGEQYKNTLTSDMVLADNGDIIVSYLTTAYNDPSYPYYMTVTRLSPQGDEIWTTRFEGFYGYVGNGIRSLLALDNGGFLVSYERDTIQGYFKRPPILVWLDSLGNITRQYNFPNYTALKIHDLIKTSSGLIVGVGEVDLIHYDLEYGGWIFAITQEGELVWNRYFTDLTFPDKIGCFSAVQETDDKGFIMTGSIRTPTGNDIWLVKLDSTGCYEPGCQDSLLILTDVKTIIQPESPAFKVYPNPAAQQFINVESQTYTGDKSSLKISILDLHGRTVRRQLYDSKVDVSNLPHGIYLLVVEQDAGSKIFAEKIIIQ